jgi:selenocysteine lyase/cysteine desulfurase
MAHNETVSIDPAGHFELRQGERPAGLGQAQLAEVRAEFPALGREQGGRPYVYLDGPGGTQVPRRAIAAMASYLERSNANHDGAFPTSQESDAVTAAAHAAAADFLGADPAEVVFGPNMTTLTFAVSRAIGRTLREGDEIVVTRLDHDANIAPWLALEEERRARVRWVEIRQEDCTLDLGSLERAIGRRTRLVAVGLASNAVGTINPVPRIADMAHAAGALTYVDAVHGAARPTSSSARTWACSTAGASCSRAWTPTRSGRPRTSRPASGRRARPRARPWPACWAPSTT